MENNGNIGNPKKNKFISKFEHEHVVWHLGRANARMLIALITVCITFIVTILVFVHGYTVREKNWLDTISHIGVTSTIETKDSPGNTR